ncbi:hypothetical protein ACJQWK_06375 [Exserohilum turcicum]
MKPSAAARLATANEILRHRNQTVWNNVLRPHRERRIGLFDIALEQAVSIEPYLEQKQQQSARRLTLPCMPAEKDCDADMGTAQMAAMEKTDPVNVRCRRSSTWTRMLQCDCTNSAILAALHLNAERNGLQAETSAQPARCDVNPRLDAWEQRFEVIGPCHEARGPREQDIFAFHVSPLEDRHAVRAFTQQASPNGSSECDSPASDTTLFDEMDVRPTSQSKDAEFTQHCMTKNGTLRNYSPCTSLHRVQEQATPPPAERLGARHRRHVSLGSAFDTVRTPSTPLQAARGREKNNLLFRTASLSRSPPRSNHGRKLSLNVPVNAQTFLPKGLCRPNPIDIKDRTEPSCQRDTTRHNFTLDALTPEERDLEYKHRHTFIGTGSLDEFLELLDISPTYCVTRNAVVGAFLRLSSTEQLRARQCSTRSEGWNLVSRTTLDCTDAASVDYMLQSRVKLGSITLRQFLDMIPFDHHNEVAAMRVVEAFSAASHIDAKAEQGVENKARVFRSWIVSRKVEAGCC